MNQNFLEETNHLETCIKIIEKQIDKYSEQTNQLKSDTKELYDNYRSNNPELHNDLVISLDWQNILERSLKKILLAKDKPYFGRIDYTEHGIEKEEEFSLYIGKQGIMLDSATPLIVDWRAPVASVYYDSDIGESSYLSPYEEKIEISLLLKRTFEIHSGKILDFYDTDVIANDEFLTKCLAKSKEVILGEIISTIQKEQNNIIRDTPWHSIIVQGVAGSGKTTVAMHRISYILYNYKDKFHPDEFYIIGSNKMLLNYITGVLPNLDVYNINQMTMFEFLEELLNKDFSLKKLKLTYKDSFCDNSHLETAKKCLQYKGSLAFIYELQHYLTIEEEKLLLKEDIIYKETLIYRKEEMKQLIQSFPNMSIQEKIDLLNKRLESKVKNHCLRQNLEKDEIREELKAFKNYFGKKTFKVDLTKIYIDFLQESTFGTLILEQFLLKMVDLYDLAALTFIKQKFKQSSDFSFVKHIVIDEAQDFGVSIFSVLKKIFPNCTYTIMGDTSQNINYNSGMNDWKALREEVFLKEKDKFYVLAKSYRNTVEISDYASNVLNHCTFETYKIQPVIRHGNPVFVKNFISESDLILKTCECIHEIQKNGYDTIAVICRTMKEAKKVESLLLPFCQIKSLPENTEEMTFTDGVMVLPIHMTKGLEFDGVILFNPDETAYPVCDASAKLLYVAITRALHELYVLYVDNLSGLLK